MSSDNSTIRKEGETLTLLTEEGDGIGKRIIHVTRKFSEPRLVMKGEDIEG